jgi:hypothetical protein
MRLKESLQFENLETFRRHATLIHTYGTRFWMFTTALKSHERSQVVDSAAKVAFHKAWSNARTCLHLTF